MTRRSDNVGLVAARNACHEPLLGREAFDRKDG